MTKGWLSGEVPPNQAARFTTNYEATAAGLTPIDRPESSVSLRPPTLAVGGAGLVSSAGDFARFTPMLLGQGNFWTWTTTVKTNRPRILSRRQFLALPAAAVMNAADPVMRPAGSEAACPLERMTSCGECKC